MPVVAPTGASTSSEPLYEAGDPAAARRPSGLAALLTRLSETLEAHRILTLLGLSTVYLLAVLAASSQKLLWHDELFTLYIAGAPSLSAMFHDIRTIDLNPPLSYLLTRLSLRLFGPSTLAVRLPEIVAFLVAMLALASFVRRRAGTLYGVLAASFLFSSLAGELAVEARPYGLLLAFSCLSLVAWQRARVPDGRADSGPVAFSFRTRFFGLCLLPVAASGMLLSHVFAILPWAVFAAAELARTFRRRTVDLAPIVGWIAPLLCCITWAPMLQNHAASAFPAAFEPTPEDIFTFYMSHVDRELITLWLTALAVLVLFGRRSLRGSQDGWRLSQPEWIATIGLLLLPGLLIAELMHAHGAWFPRYGVIASVGVAILASVFLSWWTGGDRRAALLASVIALLISGQIAFATTALFHNSLRHPFRLSGPAVPPCAVCAAVDALDPNLPLVDAGGLTFLEMDHRESTAELRRVFYLTDHAASLAYAHATIFDGMDLESRMFPMRAHVSPYSAFVAQHPHFFVLGTYDYPEDWLLRKLIADGADLRVIGRVDSPYRDHELYEVRVRPN